MLSKFYSCLWQSRILVVALHDGRYTDCPCLDLSESSFLFSVTIYKNRVCSYLSRRNSTGISWQSWHHVIRYPLVYLRYTIQNKLSFLKSFPDLDISIGTCSMPTQTNVLQWWIHSDTDPYRFSYRIRNIWISTYTCQYGQWALMSQESWTMYDLSSNPTSLPSKQDVCRLTYKVYIQNILSSNHKNRLAIRVECSLSGCVLPLSI